MIWWLGIGVKRMGKGFGKGRGILDRGWGNWGLGGLREVCRGGKRKIWVRCFEG